MFNLIFFGMLFILYPNCSLLLCICSFGYWTVFGSVSNAFILMQDFIPLGLWQSTERFQPSALLEEFFQGTQMLIHVNFQQSHIQQLFPVGNQNKSLLYSQSFLWRFQQVQVFFTSGSLAM